MGRRPIHVPTRRDVDEGTWPEAARPGRPGSVGDQSTLHGLVHLGPGAEKPPLRVLEAPKIPNAGPVQPWVSLNSWSEYNRDNYDGIERNARGDGNILELTGVGGAKVMQPA